MLTVHQLLAPHDTALLINPFVTATIVGAAEVRR